MPFFKAQDSCNLFYEEMGQGVPIIFIHGWPASHNMFEYNYAALADSGFRCIGYDRRGFGTSDRPWTGYDYNTFADDLAALLEYLDVNDVTLVGFSMGGGEVARYFSRHGGKRVAKAVFVSAVTPYMLRDNNNEHGVDMEVFDQMREMFQKDRPAALANFGKQFFSVSLLNNPVSSEFLEAMGDECMQASPKATFECIQAFSETDFREDMASVNVPTLIIHGTDDKIVPIETGGRRTAKYLPNALYVEYDGAPHGLYYTEVDQFNADIARFISEGTVVSQTMEESQT